MHIFISGGSGYIGSFLARFFLKDGHKVTTTGRRREHPLEINSDFKYIRADTTREGAWQEALDGCQVIINLAGKTIFRHWTDRYKKELRDSRILTTQNIVAALPQNHSSLLVSASAVGYYGNCGDDTLTESSQGGNDFLAEISREWEQVALSAQNDHTRVVLPRFGIILSRNGGAMARMIPAFKAFLGGPLGEGSQWFSWMHMHDVAHAMKFIIDRSNICGPVNFCAPNPVRNRELTRMLARALSRPAMVKVPPFFLRLLLGEFGETLLASQRVIPEKLIENGYEFKFAKIENAIVEIVRSQDTSS